jgi:hypothetical protein
VIQKYEATVENPTGEVRYLVGVGDSARHNEIRYIERLGKS